MSNLPECPSLILSIQACNVTAISDNDRKQTLKAKASQLIDIYAQKITNEEELTFERKPILSHDCDLEQDL